MSDVQAVSNLVQNINVIKMPIRVENSEDVNLWNSFLNEVDQTGVKSDNMAKLQELSSSSKGFTAGIPSALLRDSTLTAWQAASIVPFLENSGSLNAFFAMGLGSKEHIESAIDIVNSKYNSVQKSSGYEQSGYATLKDTVVCWSKYHNNSPKEVKAAPTDPMKQDPESFDPTKIDPKDIPMIN